MSCPNGKAVGWDPGLSPICVAQTRPPVLIGTWAASWAIRFYQRHGFELVPEAATGPLLKTYWHVPEHDRHLRRSGFASIIGRWRGTIDGRE
jgi:hypothetical protein